MKVVSQYPDGVFSWVDLGTTDPQAAKAFYSGLFGWSFADTPTDSGFIYSMGQIEGHDVAGLGPLDPDMQAQGAPPFWTSYVKHDDVDAVAERAAEAGGQVVMPPFDVMKAGRMAIIQDPAGAMFGVWQPGEHIGAKLVNMPNTLSWNELQTNDLEEAKAFYSAVFGWTYDVDDNGYVTCSQDGRVQAGMMAIQEDWGDVPPNWSVYFLVEDATAAAEKAAELGGNVLIPATPAGDIGEFALIQDPQGGVFNVIRFDGEPSPPPGY